MGWPGLGATPIFFVLLASVAMPVLFCSPPL